MAHNVDGLKIEALDPKNDIYQVIRFTCVGANQVIQTTIYVGTLEKCLNECGMD
jgi:hypothetical protein